MLPVESAFHTSPDRRILVSDVDDPGETLLLEKASRFVNDRNVRAETIATCASVTVTVFRRRMLY